MWRPCAPPCGACPTHRSVRLACLSLEALTCRVDAHLGCCRTDQRLRWLPRPPLLASGLPDLRKPCTCIPQVLDFPVRTLIRFWVNHHLLDLYQRPCWRVVSGRSKTYVDRITSGGLPQRAVHCGWWRKLA